MQGHGRGGYNGRRVWEEGGKEAVVPGKGGEAATPRYEDEAQAETEAKGEEPTGRMQCRMGWGGGPHRGPDCKQNGRGTQVEEFGRFSKDLVAILSQRGTNGSNG